MSNLIGPIIRLSKKIGRLQKSVQFNHQKCHRIMTRVFLITSYLQTSQIHGTHEAERKKNALLELDKTIKVVYRLIEKHSPNSHWLFRMLKKGTEKNVFLDLYERLYNCAHNLDVPDIDNWGHTKNDEEDENKDKNELKSLLENLKKNPKEIEKLLKSQKKQNEQKKIKLRFNHVMNYINQLIERIKLEMNTKRKKRYNFEGGVDLENSSVNVLIIKYEELNEICNLAYGSYGEVYLANWLGVDVAVKQLIPDQNNEEGKINYQNEVLTLASLRHLNIVEFLGATNKYPYCLVTKYYKHGNLSQIIHNPKIVLTLTEIIDIAKQITLGLRYLHSQKILHRDLKPDNILITEDDSKIVPKIIDFGSSKRKTDQSSIRTLCGTPQYIAPEIVRSENYSYPADIYSFGILLWEMITRQKPYEGLFRSTVLNFKASLFHNYPKKNKDKTKNTENKNTSYDNKNINKNHNNSQNIDQNTKIELIKEEEMKEEVMEEEEMEESSKEREKEKNKEKGNKQERKENKKKFKEILDLIIPDYIDNSLRSLIESCWSIDPDLRPTFKEIFQQLDQLSKTLTNHQKHFLIKKIPIDGIHIHKNFQTLKEFLHHNSKKQNNKNSKNNVKKNNNCDDPEFLFLNKPQILSNQGYLIPNNLLVVGFDENCDFSTIDEALEVIQPNDVIQLSSGIHLFNGMDITTPNLRIRGQPSISADSIIISSNSNRSVFCFKAMNCGLFGIKIIKNSNNKNADFGIIEIQEGNCIIDNCIIQLESKINNYKNENNNNNDNNIIIKKNNDNNNNNNLTLDKKELVTKISCILIKGTNSSPIIQYNHLSGAAIGVSVLDNSKCFIDKNNIFKNQLYGIYFSNSKSCLIRHNNISDNYQDGIHINSSQIIQIEDNSIFSNHHNGIQSESSKILIKLNKIFKNYLNGILLSSESNGDIIKNYIYKNTNSGIDIQTGSFLNIITNEIELNNIGITVGKNAKVHIQLNNFINNKNTSIEKPTEQNQEIIIHNNNEVNSSSSNHTNNNHNNNNNNNNNNMNFDSTFFVNKNFPTFSESVFFNNHQIEKKEKNTRRNELIVTQVKRENCYLTISDAIEAAKEGDIIKVEAGRYQEHLIITKDNLEIIGPENGSEQVIIGSNVNHTFQFQAKTGRVSRLFFRHRNENYSAILLISGNLLIQDCDLSSNGESCITVEEGAYPTITNCNIHHSNLGIVFRKGSRGLVDQCQIHENIYQGILLNNSAFTTILNTNISQNQEGGIIVMSNASCLIKNCDISFNRLSGISINTQASPRIEECRIHHNSETGCFLYSGGLGHLVNNEIYNNQKSGISCRTNSNPKIFKNKIYSNHESGIYIYNDSTGTFKENNIYDNHLSGFQIKNGANPLIESNIIKLNKGAGIFSYENALGTFKKNFIYQNQLRGIDIENCSKPIIIENQLFNNQAGGIYYLQSSSGTMSKNKIFSNKEWQLFIEQGSFPILNENEISSGGTNNENVAECD
ncbi:f-box only protein [Anaeramoeba flamelloides]|uniref:F-box only protein n=1 Tax=Anaeramoeba flamelloides TaxID=1746091 RepID=A0ABQ8YX30_9EUKA|nr:f-box only protein [Anaeramoeba flamelloides]